MPCHMPALTPDRMKQTEAGLRKKGTPLLRDMAMQMAPMAIMVRLRRASTAAVRFRSTGRSTVRRHTLVEDLITIYSIFA